MSDDGFHVHGAHEHMHHEGGQAHTGLAQSVAIVTALLSTLGAVISYQSADTLSRAMLHKNEAVLHKTEASDDWNYYQAKSTKGHLMEMAADLAPPDKQAGYRELAQKYEHEKAEVKAQAEEQERAAQAENLASERAMHPHHRQAQAMTLIQIAISLASVTALTRQRWLFVAAGIAGVGGIGLWLSALFL